MAGPVPVVRVVPRGSSAPPGAESAKPELGELRNRQVQLLLQVPDPVGVLQHAHLLVLDLRDLVSLPVLLQRPPGLSNGVRRDGQNKGDPGLF